MGPSLFLVKLVMPFSPFFVKLGKSFNYFLWSSLLERTGAFVTYRINFGINFGLDKYPNFDLIVFSDFAGLI